MILEDIVRRTDRVFPLKPHHWAWARLLGEARTASNDARRASRSDRGRSNARVDLLGALGELFLLRTAMDAEHSGDAVDHMRDHLYREEGGGGVEGPDIRFIDHVSGETRELDVKTFDCAPNKKFFAINHNKHRKLGGQCSHYLCVIAPPFGRQMAVACLVPYADVEEWPVRQLRSGGSASRNLPIETFLVTYFTAAPALDELRRSTIPDADVRQAFEDPAVRREFERLVPNVFIHPLE